MQYHKTPNLFKRILFSRSMALAIFIAIIFVGYGLASLIGKSLEASRSRKIAEVQAVELQEKKDDLSKKITDLNSAEGQEAVLREQFPVVKEGEHVVVITDQSAQADTNTKVGAVPQSGTAPTGEKPQTGFWNFLKNLFR